MLIALLIVSFIFALLALPIALPYRLIVGQRLSTRCTFYGL